MKNPFFEFAAASEKLYSSWKELGHTGSAKSVHTKRLINRLEKETEDIEKRIQFLHQEIQVLRELYEVTK